MSGGVPGPGMADTVRRMVRGHQPLLDALGAVVPHGATDVTGFGLARHLMELLGASAIGARLHLGAVPTYAGALERLRDGVRSTFHEQNRLADIGLHVMEGVDPVALELLFDPQTCGPMLLVLGAEEAADLVARTDAVVIGVISGDVPAGTLEVHP
jgi:selenide, water dikinase